MLYSSVRVRLAEGVYRLTPFTEIEGKLDTLADKVFDRYVNRFFDNESELVAIAWGCNLILDRCIR
jgi:hypothetical protein